MPYPSAVTKSSEYFHGRVALVTGGAKRLGGAIALRLAQEGAAVVVHFRSSEAEAQATLRKIEGSGGHGMLAQADLLDIAQIRRMMEAVRAKLSRLDVLVNSAANFLPGTIESTTEAGWDASLDANLKAPFFCAQAAASLLKESRGCIINVADTGGIEGWTGYLGHSISKAGVIHLTRCLAKALAPEVRVNAVAPGTITMPGDPPEWERDFSRIAPLGRSGTPREITDAIVYLASAEFVTGQVLVVDGGSTL